MEGMVVFVSESCRRLVALGLRRSFTVHSSLQQELRKEKGSAGVFVIFLHVLP